MRGECGNKLKKEKQVLLTLNSSLIALNHTGFLHFNSLITRTSSLLTVVPLIPSRYYYYILDYILFYFLAGFLVLNLNTK